MAASLAGALVACGGGASSSESSQGPAGARARSGERESTAGEEREGAGKSAEAAPEKGSDDTAGAEGQSAGGSAAEEAEPEPPSAVGPSAEFRVPHGDNSIQDFGAESGDAAREAASASLETYMSARAARRWGSACAVLAPAVYEPIEELAAPGAGCAATFATIAKRAPSSAWKNTMDGPIDSLRIDGARAFALYHGVGNVDYFIPMSVHAGAWKVAALEPTEFP